MGDGSSRGGMCFGIKRSLGGEEVATECFSPSIGVELDSLLKARSLLVRGRDVVSPYGI